MVDGFASLDALVDNGVLAYKNREFKSAIENLQRVLDVEPRHWRAKLYLAMSYYHGGELYTAYRHFTFLQDNCTDMDIRDKASAALRFITKPTPTQGVPVCKTPDKAGTTYEIDGTSTDAADDDSELEWVPTRHDDE